MTKIPDIAPGDVISAGYLNDIRDAAVRNLRGAGSFVSAGHVLTAPTFVGEGGTVGSSDSITIDYVLIDSDIDAADDTSVSEDDKIGVIEYPDEVLADTSDGATFEDPDGTPVSELRLWEFAPLTVSLKYYRPATSSDPGYDPGVPKQVLVTEEVPNDTSFPDGDKHWRYALRDYVYLDGDAFKVGEYKRSDYPDLAEDDAFPPEDLPVGFLNKRYRGIAVNGVLVTMLCRQLPPPPLPETSS